jgi:threonine dehydratase
VVRYNMLAQLSPGALAAGVITYSSGNHGQAMALAARLLGVNAVVVMPETAPQVKVKGARRLGAEVLFAGTTVLDRKARAESEAAARGLTMVPPFDHPWIIAGQGTCGLEIVDQSPSVTTVYVPIGGGGLVSGVAVGCEDAAADGPNCRRRAGRCSEDDCFQSRRPSGDAAAKRRASLTAYSRFGQGN